MNLDEAYEDAGDILTLLAMIPVGLIVLGMSRNMNNPHYDMTAALEQGIFALVEAVMPSWKATVVLAIGLWLLSKDFNGTDRRRW